MKDDHPQNWILNERRHSPAKEERGRQQRWMKSYSYYLNSSLVASITFLSLLLPQRVLPACKPSRSRHLQSFLPTKHYFACLVVRHSLATSSQNSDFQISTCNSTRSQNRLWVHIRLHSSHLQFIDPPDFPATSQLLIIISLSQILGLVNFADSDLERLYSEFFLIPNRIEQNLFQLHKNPTFNFLCYIYKKKYTTQVLSQQH